MLYITVGGAEAAAPLLAQYLYGKNSEDLSADEKSTISAITGLVATGVDATSTDIGSMVQSGQVAQNAVKNNYLTQKQISNLQSSLNALNNAIAECRDKACVEKINKERKKLIDQYKKISKEQDIALKTICFSQPNSSVCTSGIKSALEYNGGVTTGDAIARNLLGDKFDSSKNTLNIIYNSPSAKNLISTRVNSIDDRANFFGTNNTYYQSQGIDIRWFGAAEIVSRAPITGLGADGNLSYMTFGAGKLFGNPDLYAWRAEAGNTLTEGGFNNFKNAFQGYYTSAKDWDINQLRSEQKLLQPIHEKYLSNYPTFRYVSKKITGVTILDYNSRIDFGCAKMKYSQGCTP